MKFENIGGNSRASQYSLYDYSENPFGETIMSIEVNRQDGSWWFVETSTKVMNKKHMEVLHTLLSEILEVPGEVKPERKGYMVSLKEAVNDEIRNVLKEKGMVVVFESNILATLMGIEADSLESIQELPFVAEAREPAVGYLPAEGYMRYHK